MFLPLTLARGRQAFFLEIFRKTGMAHYCSGLGLSTLDFWDQQTDWHREAKPLGKLKFCSNQSMVPFAVALGLRIPS